MVGVGVGVGVGEALEYIMRRVWGGVSAEKCGEKWSKNDVAVARTRRRTSPQCSAKRSSR